MKDDESQHARKFPAIRDSGGWGPTSVHGVHPVNKPQRPEPASPSKQLATVKSTKEIEAHWHSWCIAMFTTGAATLLIWALAYDKFKFTWTNWLWIPVGVTAAALMLLSVHYWRHDLSRYLAIGSFVVVGPLLWYLVIAK